MGILSDAVSGAPFGSQLVDAPRYGVLPKNTDTVPSVFMRDVSAPLADDKISNEKHLELVRGLPDT